MFFTMLLSKNNQLDITTSTTNFEWPFTGTISITTDKKGKYFTVKQAKEISNTRLNSEIQIHSVMISPIIPINMYALVPAQTVFSHGRKLQSPRVFNGTGTTKIKLRDLEYIVVSLAVPRLRLSLSQIGMKVTMPTMKCGLTGAFSQLTKTPTNKNALVKIHPMFTKYTKITMISTITDSSTHYSSQHGCAAMSSLSDFHSKLLCRQLSFYIWFSSQYNYKVLPNKNLIIQTTIQMLFRGCTSFGSLVILCGGYTFCLFS